MSFNYCVKDKIFLISKNIWDTTSNVDFFCYISFVEDSKANDIFIIYSKLSLAIYPNPSSDGIFQIEGGEVAVTVTDNLSRIIYQNVLTSTIELSGYAAGVYTAHLSNDQGSTTLKLVIN